MLERDVSSEITASCKLSERCRFIPGAKQAAIYDFEKGNVYSLNKSAREIVEGAPDKFNFWKKLVEMDLVETGKQSRSLEVTESPRVGLEFMWLELTDKCNQKCLHCYASANDIVATEERPEINWEKIIAEGKTLGCNGIQFIGGEPLLFPGLLDLAQTAKDSGYEFIEIFTNGTLLDEGKVKKIKDLGINVAVSLYSIDPNVHDTVTTVLGSFQKTYRALELLREAQVPTRIGIIVMRQNQDTLVKTRETLRDKGFEVVGADVVRPTGRGSCAELLPKKEVVQKYALTTKPNFVTSEEQFYRNQYWNSCWAGKIAITSRGEIMPCIFARTHIVSRVENGLGGAINGEELQSLWKLTKDCIQGCRECEYRYACHDCRPLAEGATGNLYAKNPRCTYNPVTGKWNEKRKGGDRNERTRA